MIILHFDFHAEQSHFHKNGFALRLALKKRRKGTRKWPIAIRNKLDANILKRDMIITDLKFIFGLPICHSLEFLNISFQVAQRSSGSREVLLISTERISGEGTPKTTEPAKRTSWRSINPDKNDEPDSGATPIQYFKYDKNDSTSPR